MRSPPIMPGEQFNRLRVVRRVEDKVPGRPRFECACACGNTTIVSSTALRSNNTKSCGCLLREFGRGWAPQMSRRYRAKDKLVSATIAVERDYRLGASERGLSFELSQSIIGRLITEPCWYCGQPPSREIKTTRSLGFFSGIDRKDNSIGYTTDNCVSCCRQCNAAKGKLSSVEFIAWAHQAFSHLKVKG